MTTSDLPDSQNSSTNDIATLVNQLSSNSPTERQAAREALVMIGTAAVPALSALAGSPDDHVRWECAKSLAAIADASSVDTLIRLLEDSSPDTGWDAALGLIAIGRPSVSPLLKAIADRTVDFKIIAGARHAIHEFAKTNWGSFLGPVYDALSAEEPAVAAPIAAAKALETWKGDVSQT